MPYDTYDLLVKKLSKPKVWTLNVDELCEEINILYESEVQQLKDNELIMNDLVKALDNDITKLKQELFIERDYNIRFRNENRELKNEICMLKTELKNRISLETGNILKQENRELKDKINNLRAKDI
jgi:hypothetical protein